MDSTPTKPGKADQEVRLPGVIRRLEKATVAAESPIRRMVGSGRLNPLPHAGTISVFLLIVVTITGLYLTFFFEFGFADSYRAVARMQDNPVQRVVRALHRYSSAALVVTTLVHAWRTFVMRRFTGGPRRWRWLSGVLALAVVWMAGVTGYWLVWDTRAQALTEAFATMMGTFSSVWEMTLLSTASSGWVPLLLIWTIHLVLTIVVGYAVWRHVRKSRHAWLPERRWMAMMTGALVVASIWLPLEMLAPANPGAIPGSMPLDPFVMFLLPPLLGSWPWGVALVAIVVGVTAALLPWLLRRHDPPIAAIVAERCTGCELCVIDCPYFALGMSTTGDGAIAVVDPERCVGCGICVGSCSFGAIDGFGAPEPLDGISGPVVLACSRHVEIGKVPADSNTIAVRCTGVVNPRVVASLMESGASSVHVVGCPPGDCAYGVGNTMTSDRLSGERRPHLPRAWSDRVSQDWVTPAHLTDAIRHPGRHDSAAIDGAPGGWARWAPVVGVVAASVILIGLSTGLPFANDTDMGEIRVLVDHRPGSTLTMASGPTGGFPVTVEILAGGRVIDSRLLADGGERVMAVVDLPVTAGRADWQVRLVEGNEATVLASFDGIAAGRRHIVAAVDTPPPPGAELGEALFSSAGLGENLGCEVCHSLRPDQTLVGPSLAGVATRAGDRAPGLEAEAYLRQSIVDPDAYTVEGYPAGQMLQDYEERLTPDELDALVAYLMTLTEGGG